MRRFWFKLWLSWAVRLSIESLLYAFILAFLLCSAIYFSKGMPPLQKEFLFALGTIFQFSFMIFWSITLLVSLFRGLKYLFNRCYEGYALKLLTCKGDEVIETIGYGDLTPLFRKWMMSMILSLLTLMILSFIVSYFLLSFYNWYNIYVMYIFILISGGITLPLMGHRCKGVKLYVC
ncbi:MAG: hypothetical protein PHX13_09370 [Thiovulaceae bacterium]|nr:hypothetical protein [Sulfurimonadaceae bacterium]